MNEAEDKKWPRMEESERTIGMIMICISDTSHEDGLNQLEQSPSIDFPISTYNNVLHDSLHLFAHQSLMRIQ